MSWKQIEKGIRRRIDAQGQVTYYVDVQRNEKRVRKAVGPNLDMAKQIRSQLLIEAAEQEHFPERQEVERVRLSVFADRYVADYLSTKAAKSWKRAESRVRAIVRMLGNPYVDTITAGDVEHLLADLRRAGKSPATVNRYRTRLNNMMRKAVAWNFRRDNPAAQSERLTEHKLGDRYLTRLEFDKLLAACEKAADRQGKDGPDTRASIRPLVHLAGLTGMRQGELMQLCWEDIDPDLAFVSLQAEDTKTGEPRRVHLVSEAREVLSALGPRTRGRIFPWQRFPRKQWNRAIKALKWNTTEIPRLRGWRFHDLRHHTASTMVMAGMSLPKVGKVLGHKSWETTMRYAHLAPESVADDMERAFARSPRQTSVKRQEPAKEHSA